MPLSLISPQTLHNELTVSTELSEKVEKNRQIINQILQGKDDRLLVIVGPCSIHDLNAAKEYANFLQQAIQQFKQELYIVMRVYFEKPRTTVGWRGLISDPFLNGSFDVNTGLRLARKLLIDLNDMDVPSATEFLDTIIPPYLSDLISWTAIGARTSASQIHRELASGLPMAVGFKNSIDGNLQIAIDAITVAAHPQPLLSIGEDGSAIIILTKGNPFGHLILRGGDLGPNYELKHIQYAEQILKDANVTSGLIIDCSHGNSMKNYHLQQHVLNEIAQYIQQGSEIIKGVMIESNLIAGKQMLGEQTTLIYGKSITDGCLSWQETFPLLEQLAFANKKRQLRKYTITKTLSEQTE